MRERILNGPILKTMLVLAWPVMVTQGLQQFYNLIDTFWLGRLSTEAVSAVTMAWPIIFTFMAVAMGFQVAGSALVAQYTGAGDRAGADRAGTQLLSFLFLLSLVTAALGHWLAEPALRLLGTPTEVMPLAVRYLRIVSLGFPLMYTSFAFMGLMLGVGDTRTPMYVNGASVVLNAFLDPLFIFGLGPFPELGVAGAAIATVTARGVAAVVGVWLLGTGRVGLRLRRRYLLPQGRWIRQIGGVATPNVVDQVASALGFVIVMGLIAGFGTTVVAAYGVGNRLINLVNVAIWGAANALLTMVGQNLGADQASRAEAIARRGIYSLVAALVLLAGTTFLIREPLYRVFIADPAVIAEGGRFLAVFAFSIPFFGLFNASAAVFRGAGHTVPPMVVSLIRLWGLRILVSWLLAYRLRMGPTGVWTGMALSNVIAGLAMYGWLRRGTWKRKVIEPKIPVVAREARVEGDCPGVSMGERKEGKCRN